MENPRTAVGYFLRNPLFFWHFILFILLLRPRHEAGFGTSVVPNP